MGRLFKRNDIWYLDVRVKGHRVRKRVGRSKRVAELALRDAEVKIARDEFGFSTSDITVEKLIERFLEYNKTNNRESTTRRYKSVTDHLCEYITTKRPDVVYASQLTTEVIEGYKSFRRGAWVNPNGCPVKSDADVTESTRKGARSRTINLEVDGIRSMLNQGMKWGFLKENPVKWMKPLKEDDKKPVRFLSKQECSALLKATPPDLYPVFYTFLNTGMRKAELEHLQWGDVDLSRRRIRICRKENWNPKSGERDIPMSDGVFEQLSRLKKKNTKASDSDYVFQVKNSGHSHNRLRRELIKIAEKADIPDLTKLHTLRHTFASHLVMQGVDLPTVKKLMGHSDITTTMIYAHLAQDHLSKAVEKLPY